MTEHQTPEPAPTTGDSVAPQRNPIRMRTVVAGLLALAIAIFILGDLAGVGVDGRVAALTVLASAGGLLLVSGLTNARNDRG